jgi:hypothetical protein
MDAEKEIASRLSEMQTWRCASLPGYHLGTVPYPILVTWIIAAPQADGLIDLYISVEHMQLVATDSGDSGQWT